jgi:hypothetical protein
VLGPIFDLCQSIARDVHEQNLQEMRDRTPGQPYWYYLLLITGNSPELAVKRQISL